MVVPITLSQRINSNDRRLDAIDAVTTYTATTMDISAALSVSGDTTIDGNVYLNQNVDISATLGVSGDATFESDVFIVKIWM